MGRKFTVVLTAATVAASGAITYASIQHWFAAAIFTVATIALAVWAYRIGDDEIALDPPLPLVVFDESDVRSPAYVENVGGRLARNVLLRPLVLDKIVYTFKRIPLLRPGDRVPLPIASARSQLGPFDARKLWRAMGLSDTSWLALATKGGTPVTVPLLLDFRDSLFRPQLERQTVHINEDGSIEVMSRSPKRPRSRATLAGPTAS